MKYPTGPQYWCPIFCQNYCRGLGRGDLVDRRSVYFLDHNSDAVIDTFASIRFFFTKYRLLLLHAVILASGDADKTTAFQLLL